AVTARVEALTEQLKQEQARLTGDDSDAMNDVTARYMVVQKQAVLAEDLYKSGLISLEQARIEAYRKLKHLLVISQPARAEEAEYP
ncbi:sugar transporter, partial [Citrobacter sp. VF227]